MHPDPDFLRSLVPRIRDFLLCELCLGLHPDKVFLGKVSDGFPFLGAFVKPYRTYLGTRTKRNFYAKIREYAIGMEKRDGTGRGPEADRRREESFVSAVNSYLGIARHFDTYRLCKRILVSAHGGFLRRGFRVFPGYGKVLPKRRESS
jgi:hypothetical protein